MNDLISRQAAIDVIFSEPLYEPGMKKRSAEEVVPAIFEKVKVLPSAHPEQRWIPVSERLPDVAQRVLLSGHGRVMVGMLHSFGKYSLEPTGISYVYPTDDIEAWMPLPEPYEGES